MHVSTWSFGQALDASSGMVWSPSRGLCPKTSLEGGGCALRLMVWGWGGVSEQQLTPWSPAAGPDLLLGFVPQKHPCDRSCLLRSLSEGLSCHRPW